MDRLSLVAIDWLYNKIISVVDTEDPTDNIVEEIDGHTWVAKIGLNAGDDRVCFQATVQIQGPGGCHVYVFQSFSI